MLLRSRCAASNWFGPSGIVLHRRWLDLQLTFQPLSMFRWQLYVAQGMRSLSLFGQDLMEESEEDKDSLKEAFLETSPYLLAVTVAVSLLHSVFEFLAFKSGEGLVRREVGK